MHFQILENQYKYTENYQLHFEMMFMKSQRVFT